MKENLKILGEPDDDSDDEGGGTQAAQNTVVSFQVKGDLVENVKRQAIELDYPLSKCHSCGGVVVVRSVALILPLPHSGRIRFSQ